MLSVSKLVLWQKSSIKIFIVWNFFKYSKNKYLRFISYYNILTRYYNTQWVRVPNALMKRWKITQTAHGYPMDTHKMSSQTAHGYPMDIHEMSLKNIEDIHKLRFRSFGHPLDVHGISVYKIGEHTKNLWRLWCP